MRKKAPNQKRAYAAHFARIERYAYSVDAIYQQATAEALKVVATVNYDPSKPFRFSDYPQTKARIDKIQRELTESVQTIVVNGVTAEWDESNMKNDQLARSVIGIKAGEAVGTRFERYFNNNSEALHSFVSRKDRGMNLSTKVWNLSKQYKADLELALSIGLSDGRSAAELSRDVRQYLREPARLFRRVMQDDRLRLSRAAKAYHPGAGQYRSSYKNAMRLTRTEINMAYRTADCTRWGQMDFVVGYEVKRSGRAYPCKVCEALADKYPKSFVWTGWHPQCRCYVIPILKTDEEFWAWDGRGEAPTESVNTVRDLPQGFKNYVAKNNKGIKEAVKRGTAPYWVRDNYHTLNPKRIKTDAEKIAIQTKWNERKTNNKINSLLDEYKIPHTNQNVYQAGAKEYHEIISTEKVKNAKGWMVDVHDQYDGCKCFLTGDKCSGIVVTADGDIASLFSSVRGDHRMEKLIMTAIENGGVKCDCYGGGLQNLYARFGATAAGKTPFNKAFAPSDWDGSSELPVVAMIFPRSIQEAVKLFNGKAEIDMRYVKIFTGKNGYLDLLKYRDKLLK